MSRWTIFLGSLTLAASLAGCGSSNNNPTPMGDLTMIAPVDMARDMMIPLPGVGTGEPCKAPADCSPAGGGSKAACTKTGSVAGNPASYPDGYCQAPCKPGNNDSMGLNVKDCPGDNNYVCSPSESKCYIACVTVAECDDARKDGKMNYVCGFVTQARTAVCIPLTSSECDPPGDIRKQGKSCMPGERCQSYSPQGDNSYGGCATICDPIKQDCPPGPNATPGCLADAAQADASGTCIGAPVGGPGEGADCTFSNSCAAGYQCLSGKCHQYCRTGGAPDGGGGAMPCPMGQTCKDIPMAKFKADKVGICS